MKTISNRWLLFLCLFVCALTPPVLLPGVAAEPAAEAAKPDPVIGTWQWSTGVGIILREDGSFSDTSPQGKAGGKWKPVDPAQRSYKLLWRIDDEVKGMDTVTLSADGKTLSGQDGDGKAVSGRRQDDRPPAASTTNPPPPQTGSATGDARPSVSVLRNTLPALDLGLKAAVQNGQVVIASVEGNPFAAMADLKAGDRILTIDGKTTEGMNAEQAQAAMSGSTGSSLTLEILRRSDNSRITFSLPRIGGTPGPATPTAPSPSREADKIIKTADDLGREEKWPQAEAEYRKALRLDPTREDAWFLLGEACSAQKKWPEAEAAYRECIKLDPKSGSYHGDLAYALLRQGQRDAAIKEGREALRLGEKDHFVYEELGLNTK